jgi:predicted RNA-binding protein associated with RNAse of E/G family
MSRGLTTVELEFIARALRKAQVGRTEADRLWEIVHKIEQIVEGAKHEQAKSKSVGRSKN